MARQSTPPSRRTAILATVVVVALVAGVLWMCSSPESRLRQLAPGSLHFVRPAELTILLLKLANAPGQPPSWLAG